MIISHFIQWLYLVAYQNNTYIDILGWPKSSFGFLQLQENPNELFGQSNIKQPSVSKENPQAWWGIKNPLIQFCYLRTGKPEVQRWWNWKTLIVKKEVKTSENILYTEQPPQLTNISSFPRSSFYQWLYHCELSPFLWIMGKTGHIWST